jgi:hypothetical protein
MVDKKWSGILLCLLLVAGVIIAGCSSDSGDSSTSATVTTAAPVAKYVAGDIIAKTDSGNEQQLYVITNYNSATDEYSRAWIYKNSDGSWGHFIDSKTEKSPRTLVEKVYLVKIHHVTISSVPVITPTVPVAANITYIGEGPTVTNITPSNGVKDGSVTVTITGNNFVTGATPKLVQPGSAPVTGTATSVSSTSISTTFNMYQKDSGTYDVIVVNPDGRSDILSSAFTIGEAVPVITAISPDTVEMNQTDVSFTINGQNFKTTGVTVTFLLGSTEIPCVSPAAIDSTKISCGPVAFKKSYGATVGLWDVKVLNIEGQQSGTASQKFTITNSTIIAD